MELIFAQTNSPSGSGIAAFLPMILIGLIFYFLILRPQTQQRKKHELELSNLKIGDKIITRGGIYGKIESFQGKNNSKVLITSGTNIKLLVSRSYLTIDNNIIADEK